MIRLVLLALIATLMLNNTAHADYFLHWDQKADLLMRGEMTGEDAARYNIWVVPGYVGPVQQAKKGWQDAGKDLTAYGHGAMYQRAYQHGKGALRFAARKSIGRFALKGSYQAWGDAFSAAHTRTERRVFGWWFAYPWALIEAVGESAVRVSVGVPGGVLIGGVGSTVVPAVELVWPAVKSAGHASVPGTVVPLVAASWNTTIAPPLAMLGQQPNAQRSDGFWVKRINDAEREDSPEARVKADADEWLRALAQVPEMQKVWRQKLVLRQLHQDKIKALRAQLNAEQEAAQADQAALDEQLPAIIQQQNAAHSAASTEHVDTPALAAHVRRFGWSQLIPDYTRHGDEMDFDTTKRLLTLLITPEAKTATDAPSDAPSDAMKL